MLGVFFFAFGDLDEGEDLAAERVVRQHGVVLIRGWHPLRLRGAPFVSPQIIGPRVRIVRELCSKQDVQPPRRIASHVAAAAKFGLRIRFHPGPGIVLRIVNQRAFPGVLPAEGNRDLMMGVPGGAPQRREARRGNGAMVPPRI